MWGRAEGILTRESENPSCLQVRTKMVGHTEAFYSDYTCYTGISDFTPPDIDVGE